jgi:hypothetical protein
VRSLEKIEREALSWSWEYRDHLRVLLLGSVLSRDEPADWIWIDDASRELERMRDAAATYPHVQPFLALVDEALSLSHDDRRQLMEKLVESIEADPESISPELLTEIERRISQPRLR